MRWQFIRFYIGTVVVLLLAAGVFFLFVQRDLEKDQDERMERYMTPYVTKVREKLEDAPEDLESRAEILEGIHYTSDWSHRREGRRGRPLPTHIADEEELSLSRDARERLDNGDVVVVRDGEKRLVYAAGPAGEILVIEPPTRRGREREGDRWSNLMVLLAPPLAILLLIGVTIYLLIRPIERRLSALVEVTGSFGADALDRRVQVGRAGAIDELEQSFNAMADRIEKLVDGQRELLRAVSHDLRTPLARVFFALDDAQMAGDVDTKNKHLNRMDRSLVELNDLVDELLTFLHLDEAGRSPEKEWIDIAPLLGDSHEMVSDLRQEINIEVSCDEEQVLADRRYLKRAVGNLVANAIMHAKSGVWLTCHREKGCFILSVHDDGPGIPEEDREKVFEPFFRRDPSRSADPGGSGLGLAIVARIMSWHQGRVLISESSHGGACFTLSFPEGDEKPVPSDEA